VLAIGTGTSWHAASQAAELLRAAGLDAWAAQSADAATDGPLPGEGDALLAFTHTGAKRYTAQAVQGARSAGAEVIQISGVGVDGADLVTVPRERSSAYTASHLGALARAAQLARALGADLAALSEVPAAVESAYRTMGNGQLARPPSRLCEFIGGGINQWTAAEGALKIREAAYVASEGLGVEQFAPGTDEERGVLGHRQHAHAPRVVDVRIEHGFGAARLERANQRLRVGAAAEDLELHVQAPARGLTLRAALLDVDFDLLGVAHVSLLACASPGAGPA